MLSQSCLILGLAAIGSSFTLPDGLPNGSYRAYYNEAGEQVHELISETTLNTTYSPLPKRDPSLAARQGSLETWCGCGDSMNTADTNNANAGLGDQVASYPLIEPGNAFFTISNTAVAFVCNVDDKSANIPTDAVTSGSWYVSQACGLFIAGTSRIQWPEALDYGYMNYRSGLNFCEDAQGSASSTCDTVYWIGRTDPSTDYGTGSDQYSCEPDQSVWTIYYSSSGAPEQDWECKNFGIYNADTGTKGVIGTCTPGDYNNGWYFCPESDGSGRLYKQGDAFYRTCSQLPNYEIGSCLSGINCVTVNYLVMTCRDSVPI